MTAQAQTQSNGLDLPYLGEVEDDGFITVHASNFAPRSEGDLTEGEPDPDQDQDSF
jgi:hypothetical protein